MAKKMKMMWLLTKYRKYILPAALVVIALIVYLVWFSSR